jgi:NAD(P)-dependent dehydrogenase (short-subunit alcohol dehydrogenase family)
MTEMNSKVWLITGSSRDLGRALAEGVLAVGNNLITHTTI